MKRFYPVWPKISSHAFILTQKEVDAELEKPENKDVMVGRVKKAKRYATPLLLWCIWRKRWCYCCSSGRSSWG